MAYDHRKSNDLAEPAVKPESNAPQPHDPPPGAVTSPEESPDEIEQAQDLPAVEQTYPAWASALTFVVLFVFAALTTAYFFV